MPSMPDAHVFVVISQRDWLASAPVVPGAPPIDVQRSFQRYSRRLEEDRSLSASQYDDLLDNLDGVRVAITLAADAPVSGVLALGDSNVPPLVLQLLRLTCLHVAEALVRVDTETAYWVREGEPAYDLPAIDFLFTFGFSKWKPSRSLSKKATQETFMKRIRAEVATTIATPEIRIRLEPSEDTSALETYVACREEYRSHYTQTVADMPAKIQAAIDRVLDREDFYVASKPSSLEDLYRAQQEARRAYDEVAKRVFSGPFTAGAFREVEALAAAADRAREAWLVEMGRQGIPGSDPTPEPSPNAPDVEVTTSEGLLEFLHSFKED